MLQILSKHSDVSVFLLPVFQGSHFLQGICLQKEGYDVSWDGRCGGACLYPVLLAAFMHVDKRNLKQFQKPAEPARSLQSKGYRRLVQKQHFTYTAAFLSTASGLVY